LVGRNQVFHAINSVLDLTVADRITVGNVDLSVGIHYGIECLGTDDESVWQEGELKAKSLSTYG